MFSLATLYAEKAYWVTNMMPVDDNPKLFSVLIGYKELSTKLVTKTNICLAGRAQGTKFMLTGYDCDSVKLRNSVCKKIGNDRHNDII